VAPAAPESQASAVALQHLVWWIGRVEESDQFLVHGRPVLGVVTNAGVGHLTREEGLLRFRCQIGSTAFTHAASMWLSRSSNA
jgi:hypothetical protein